MKLLQFMTIHEEQHLAGIRFKVALYSFWKSNFVMIVAVEQIGGY